MDSSSKRKEVTALIDSIKEHSDRLKDSSTFPMLEMSVILSKINRLHESTLILKFLMATEQHTEDKEFGVSDFGIKPIMDGQAEFLQEEEEEEWAKEEAESADSNELEDGEEIIVEMEVEEESTELEDGEEIIVEMEVEEEEETPAELEDGEENRVEMELEEQDVPSDNQEQEEENDMAEALLSQLSEEEIQQKPDVNEQFSQKEDNSVGDRLQMQPIQDLVAAIGLNERYLYANALYEGDLELFKEELSKLNELENLATATDFFEKEMRERRGWESEDEMVIALKNLVKRRFL